MIQTEIPVDEQEAGTKAKHTPGPWTVGHEHLQDDTWFYRVYYSDNRGIFEIATIDKRRRPQATANARLISAAPDMLEALQAIVLLQRDQGRRNLPECAAIARAAIAKATEARER